MFKNTTNEERINLSNKMYPLYDGLSKDLLFYIAIDTLFLSVAKEKKLGRLFGLENNHAIELKDAFSKIKFEGLDGKTFSIKPSNNIMEKDMSRDLDILESEKLER